MTMIIVQDDKIYSKPLTCFEYYAIIIQIQVDFVSACENVYKKYYSAITGGICNEL